MLKKNYKYGLFFFFFLIILIIFGNNGNDTIWNYGMAHAIRIGEIPYKDFNIISTPLYAFIMSLGLFIKDTYFVYILEQALLCTIFIFLVEKLIDKNYLLVLISFCFPIFNLLFPSYNFFVLLLLVVLLYLEKNKKPNYLIGIVLGLLILSKHTIGGFVLFFSMISTLNFKRGFKRLLYALIPISIFGLYLIITDSLYSFIDLSILGMFDFGKNNSSIFIFSIIVSLLVFIYTIYSIYKDKTNIYNYYLLGSMIFVIPICDLFHIFYLICFFLIVFLLNHKIVLTKKRLYFTSAIFVSLIIGLNIVCNYSFLSNIGNNNLTAFKGKLLDTKRIVYVNNILRKYKSYDNRYMISMASMFFDIESNNKITYFDIPLHGNFGYNGIEKMKKKIDKCHNSYFFLSDSTNIQFSIEFNDYIRKKYDYVDRVEDYTIYYIK